MRNEEYGIGEILPINLIYPIPSHPITPYLIYYSDLPIHPQKVENMLNEEKKP